MSVLFADGKRWPLDDEVISRLVEDAIDSESREILTLSRSRLVSQADFFIHSRNLALCGGYTWFHILCIFPRFMTVARFSALLQLLYVFPRLATGIRFPVLSCGRVLSGAWQ